MGAFDMMNIAGSGLSMHQTWLDTLSYNIANVNTVRATSENAFQAQYLMAQAQDGASGVRVSGIAQGDPNGRLVYQPDHPLADEEGYVRMPDFDLGSQMSQLIMAQRGYQANLAVVDRAKDAYQAALQLGRS
jgi:flagellar basal-body rod protein FlgC